MKLHTGKDRQAGLMPSASLTTTKVQTCRFCCMTRRPASTATAHTEHAATGTTERHCAEGQVFTNKHDYRNSPLTDADKETNRNRVSVRSKVEHPFLVLKRLWGFAKIRYRGLAKNANRAFTTLAMININNWGRPVTGEVRPA